MLPADRAIGALEISDAWFSYDPERPVLRGVSLLVQPGERVAIMGPSGEGKSTLAALIARFYDPSKGSVMLDGRDLRSVPLTWLRSQVGVVLQDTVLFTGTVADNIAYGVAASRERVEKAARAAGAHTFISALPQGYDSPLGPRGVALSGGQRQRISIARTLLRDPPLLLLDEPTTGLDRDSEREVLRGLDTLMQGRTTIIITHAEALAATADRILTLREGCVAVAAGEPFTEPATPIDQVVDPVIDLDDGWDSAGPGTPPFDASLPMMPSLLRPADVTESLQSIAGSEHAISSVDIDRVSYFPGQRVVVHYVVTFADGDVRHVTATATPDDRLVRRISRDSAMKLAARVNGRSGVRAPLSFDPGLRALIQWLPLDLKIPALATEPAELHGRLNRAGVTTSGASVDGELLRYRPRRRAVVRMNDHVVKYYAYPEHFQAAAAGLLVSARLGSIPTPRMEAVLFDLLATVQSFEGGTTPSSEAAAVSIGQTVSSLHACEPDPILPHVTAREQLREARMAATLVAQVAPELADPLDRLVSMLAWTMPYDRETVTSHGDLHVRQFLQTGTELRLVDFDHMCAASPAYDLSTLAAHLVVGREGDLDRAHEVLALVLNGYGRTPDDLAWYTAVGVLRLSARPLRHFASDWRERTARIVEDAGRLLTKVST
jgi:ABC-type lipoprotein export system ATPase subunit